MAQSSNITLYGRLNLSLEAVNGQAIDPNLPANAAPVNRTIYRVNRNLVVTREPATKLKGSEAPKVVAVPIGRQATR